MYRYCSSLVVGLVVGHMIVGCSTNNKGACDSANDCPRGQICIANECLVACNSSDDCAARQECIDGACYDLVACTATSECPDGYHCGDGTTCRPMLTLGASCTATSDPCASGYCVDGMCCNTACGGACQRCHSGRCELFAAGSDPEDECPGLAACDGDGGCAALDKGSTCDVDAACSSNFCANEVCCEERCDAVCEECDQEGRCRDVLNGEDPGSCDATTQGGGCSNPPCACDSDGRCRSAGGASCELGTECISDACIDQACCAEACFGACFSCAELETGAAGGLCAPVLEGRDPRDGCAGVLACDGTGGCENSWSGIKQLDSDGDERALGVATDSAGNVYVAGYTTGILDDATAAGETDAFVAKYGRTGELVWVRQIGTEQADEGWCIGLDGDENLYLVGSTVTHFDSGSPVFDVYVVKLDIDGNEVWARAIGTDVTDRATGCHVDVTGQVYAAGSTRGLFAGTAYNGGFSDAIALGVDADGNEMWRQQLGTSGLDVARAIGVGDNGIAYLAGNTSGTLGTTSHGSNDFFVAAVSASGDALLWILQDGTDDFDTLGDLVLDGEGTAYVAGTTLGAFPGFSNPSMMNDVFVARYNLETQARSWVRQFGSTDPDGSTAVNDEGGGLVYAAGGVYVTGTVGGTLPNAAWAGLSDLFLGRLNGVGEIVWLRQAGTTGSDYGNALAVNEDGDVFAACDTDGSFPGNDAVEGQAACVVKYNSAGEVQ